jgi:hypothetical protein
VGDFKQQFEDLVYHIRLFDKSISDTFLVTQFMLGLKNEIRMLVEPYFPDSVPKATGLALLQEKMLAKNTNAKPSYFRQHVSGKSDTTTTSGELWKAKQLKEYRRANGLCYKCGDKYTPGHSVRLQQLLSLISLPQRKLRMGVLFCLMRS